MLVQHTYDAKAQEEEARIQTILFDLSFFKVKARFGF